MLMIFYNDGCYTKKDFTPTEWLQIKRSDFTCIPNKILCLKKEQYIRKNRLGNKKIKIAKNKISKIKDEKIRKQCDYRIQTFEKKKLYYQKFNVINKCVLIQGEKKGVFGLLSNFYNKTLEELEKILRETIEILTPILEQTFKMKKTLFETIMSFLKVERYDILEIETIISQIIEFQTEVYNILNKTKKLNLKPLKNEFRNDIIDITIEKLIKQKNYKLKSDKIKKMVKLRKKKIKKIEKRDNFLNDMA